MIVVDGGPTGSSPVACFARHDDDGPLPPSKRLNLTPMGVRPGRCRCFRVNVGRTFGPSAAVMGAEAERGPGRGAAKEPERLQRDWKTVPHRHGRPPIAAPYRDRWLGQSLAMTQSARFLSR